jgi:hypothetical protein
MSKPLKYFESISWRTNFFSSTTCTGTWICECSGFGSAKQTYMKDSTKREPEQKEVLESPEVAPGKSPTKKRKKTGQQRKSEVVGRQPQGPSPQHMSKKKL